MLTFTGQVINTAHFPARVDPKTGEQIEARNIVQLLGSKPGPDGKMLRELEDLKVENLEPFEKLRGKQVRMFVRPWTYEGRSGLSVVKGFEPEVLP